MSLVGGFANQKATHQPRTGRDGFNRPTYGSPRTIKVRKEPDRGVKRSAMGTDVAVESYYLTEAVVNVEDKLDGVVVRRVKEIVDMGGIRLGCEVWV